MDLLQDEFDFKVTPRLSPRQNQEIVYEYITLAPRMAA